MPIILVNKLLTRQAQEAYKKGDYKEAKALYQKLDKLIGKNIFSRNILACERMLAIQQLPDKDPRTKLAASKPTTKHHIINAAVILDDFSMQCFRGCAKLFAITPSNWKNIFKNENISVLLAESAWRGNNQAWNYAFSKYNRYGEELKSVVDYCKANAIPTVFWNKEDPVNFEIFQDAARLFDHIFTTDADCIARYKGQFGHSNIYFLPFAANEEIHNPIQNKITKIHDSIAFAGSWNEKKYPDRAQWLREMLEHLRINHKVIIFDRYKTNKIDHQGLVFPSEFADISEKAVDYSDLCSTVYKSYKAFVNVSSVTNSSTMIPRRIYELSATGTPIISNYSKALSDQRLSHVLSWEKHDIDASQRISTILSDELARLSLSTQGVRFAFSGNTYKDRFASILQKAGIASHSLASLTPARPKITALCVTRRPGYLPRVIEMLERQTIDNINVIIILHNAMLDLEIMEELTKQSSNNYLFVQSPSNLLFLGDCINYGRQLSTTQYIAKIDDDDFYGPHYLQDQINAFKYTDSAIVGKNSYFCYVESVDALGLRFAGRHHRYTKLIQGGTLVWDESKVQDIPFKSIRQGTDSAFVKEILARDWRVYSTDPFNFIHIRYKDTKAHGHTWHMEDKKFLEKVNKVAIGLRTDLVFC